ncbi:MAG: hypothetical protein IKG01_04790 [Lachnospiraceae bacterium]|nr:hypothetical protein [Lachnospiraceae bacterium]
MYVNVQLIHLGRGINEVVVQNEDGGHTVFIDEQLSDQGRKNAYRHAMRHIEEDDFGRHGDVQEIETRARKNPERELRECQ